MKFITLKEEQKELLKNLIIDHIIKDQKRQINNQYTKIKEIANDYVNAIKLNDKDYELLSNQIIETLLIRNEFTNCFQIEEITKTLKNISNVISTQYYTQDQEIYIYANTSNNYSYLINYDNLEDTWYASIIETNSLNLIEELFEGDYNNLILFLKNLKSR